MADPSRVRMSGPLADYTVGFAQELDRRGYPRDRVTRHLQLFAHLSRWLERQGLAAEDLSQERMAEYLEAKRAQGYSEVPSKRWMATLLGWVPGVTLIPATTDGPKGPVETVLEAYRHHLVAERGLAAGTIRGYVSVARCFLAHWDQLGMDLSGLSAAEVTAYVVRKCRQQHVGSAKVMVTGLRSLLRFLFLSGRIGRQLAGAVQSPSGSGGHLPRALDPDVVARLLASCDPGTVVGRRDLAILTMLARLGLRIGEVAGLELNDVDWHHGELAIEGKGARRERLPLPVDVGEALVAYLSAGRPPVACRAVFVRVHAPIAALSPSSVSGVVGRACRRAEVPPASAHRLRHSAATTMLRKGATLTEVGQVLRQSRPSTTAMYAKVDRVALRALAQPWPGGAA
jgi:integrase/recombinase XerD